MLQMKLNAGVDALFYGRQWLRDGDVHVTSHTDTNTTEEKEVKDGDSGAEIAIDSSAASTYHLAIAVSMILVGAALQ